MTLSRSAEAEFDNGNSTLQAIPRPEYPRHQGQVQDEEPQRHRETDPDGDIRCAIEAPAEAADQIDHRVEQAEGTPAAGQHIYGIESAAEESERGDHQHRDELQLLEAFGPDADDEAEQAEGHRC